MAANRAPRAPRITLAALNAAAAIALVRVFAGAAWLIPAVLAALLPHALFAFSDRRRWSPFAALIGICVIGTVFAMVIVNPVPGQETRVDLTPDKVGTFSFHCDVFCGDGHEDMEGTLIVEA